MNPQRLLQHFETISDAPDAVAKLRRLVLDLAVRGKLVEQDPNDEPASLLLSRIAKQKKEGGFAIAPGNAASNAGLPSGWVNATLNDYAFEVCTGPFGSALHQSDYVFGGVPLVNPSHMIEDKIIPDHRVAVSERMAHQLSSYRLKAGDIVMARRGEVGRAALVTAGQEGWVCGTGSFFLRFSDEVDRRFLLLVLRSPSMRQYLAGKAVGTTMFNLNHRILKAGPLGIPPLAEQHRIVAKVDELMALCDQLDAARTRREATRDRLAAASLARLKTPDPDTFGDDARFALDALQSLSARPDQITHLRQTILSLAVLGKLVPTNCTGETASEQVKRIHKSRLSKRNFAEVAEDLQFPEIPAEWKWVNPDQISADQDNSITDGPFGSQLKTAHYIERAGFRVVRLQNIGPGVFRDEHRSFIDEERYSRLRKHHVHPGDLVVAGLVDPAVRACEIPSGLGPALVKADCYRLAVHPLLSRRYVLHYLNSPLAQTFASVHHHGMTLTRIGLGNFRRIPVPLPPIEEQHCIVAKVEELLTLCDQLEATLTHADTIRRRLLDSLLHEALAPALEAAA